MTASYLAKFISFVLLLALVGCSEPDQSAVDGGGDSAVETLDDLAQSEVAADSVAAFDVVLKDAVQDGAVDSAADEVAAIEIASEIGVDVGIDGAEVCADEHKVCAHVFSYNGSGSELSVEVRGSFDGWKKGLALVASGATWSGTVKLPWDGAVQYKFRIVQADGSELWTADSANPDSVDDTFGGKNSLIQSLQCADFSCAAPMTICGIPAKAKAFDWHDAVLYFVFVDRFVNGDPKNDNKNGKVDPAVDWNGGDWKGVQNKIEDGYFANLGVNALWLTVPMDNTDAAQTGDDNKLYTAYHGYWPRDVAKTQARFGSLAELKALVDSAHSHGIAVILDYAMNHVHVDSPVYQAHKNDGWFHPQKLNGKNCTCGSNTCPWDGPAAIYCWFTDYLADFDMNNADARKASVDNVIWWLQQTGADGLRLDAIKHVEGQWLLDLRARLNTDIEPTLQQHVYLVGETYTGDQAFIKTFLDPCAKLDGQFDFPLRAMLAQVTLLRQNKMQDLATFLDKNDGFYGQNALMSTFIGNHDVPRSIHYAQDVPLWNDVWATGKDKNWQDQPQTIVEKSAYERLALAMAIVLTSKGVPLIYYGDEVGMAGAGDPDNRRPMQFDGYNDGQKWLLNRMQSLGKLRGIHPAMRRGKRTTLFIGDNVWAYQLEYGADKVIVALNRGENMEPVDGLPGGQWVDAFTGETVAGSSTTLAARQVRLLVAMK